MRSVINLDQQHFANTHLYHDHGALPLSYWCAQLCWLFREWIGG